LCANLGVKFRILPIEDPFSSFLGLLDPLLKDAPSGLCEENLQARIRGLVLMAWSNRYDSLLLATGNKSELATGYCTLYGDMCGALSPIGDLFKGEVYALSRHVNERGLTIPEAILTKAPSAELKPDQCDQDTLPPYEILDAILERHIVRNESLGTIVAAGYDGKLVRRIMTMVAKAEYKRRQAAPVIKVSSRAFGTGRRIPMARAIYEAGDA
jgi:NAD+ synthase (glutamine-hydrolysing)